MPSLPPASVLRELLLYVVLPALAAAETVLALCLLSGRKGSAALGAALALVAGMGVSNYFREAMPWLPEQSAWQWLPAMVLAALAVGLVTAIPKVPRAVGWLLRAGVAGAATWLLVSPDLRTQMWWAAPAFFAVVFANWIILESSAHRSLGGALAASLALAHLGGAMVLIHAHSARLADISFMAAASLAGIALIASLKQADTATAMPGGAMLLPGLLLAGYSETFSEVPWVSFVLIALAPLALVPTFLPPASWLRGALLRLLQLGLLLAPVVVAVALAMKAEPMEFDEGPGDDSGEAERQSSAAAAAL